MEEAGRAFMPSKDAQELFMAALIRAYERACEALLRDHAALARIEHDNQRVLNNRCPVSPNPAHFTAFFITTCWVGCPNSVLCCGSRITLSGSGNVPILLFLAFQIWAQSIVHGNVHGPSCTWSAFP